MTQTMDARRPGQPGGRSDGPRRRVARRLRGRAGRPRRPACRRHVRRRQLLARPDLVLVEHHHGREPRRRRRPARRDASTAPTPAGSPPRSRPTRPTAWSTAWFTFETAVGRGTRPAAPESEDGEDKAWTFLTTMYELKGHEEPRWRVAARWAPSTARTRSRTTWLERQQEEAESLGLDDPAVRAGHRRRAGRHRAGRPAAPARRARLVIDKHARPGDQWRNRYKSLCLHDPVWYDHLPYLKFPDNWPVFAPKDKIGDWLESYTKVMEVPYWSQHGGDQRGVLARRPGSGPSRSSARASRSTLRPKQLVLATGMSGKPNVPAARPGRLPRRPAPLLGAPRPGRVRRQEGRGDRQQQLGLRHLRGPVGARRRRDDGAALLDAHRQERQPDGHRARRRSTPRRRSRPG